MKKYSKEIKAFIAENVKGMTTKALVELVNAKFDTNFTVNKMRGFKKNHKLKSGTKLGVPAGLPTKNYPKEVKEFMEKNHKGVGPQDMAYLLNKIFGTDYSYNQIRAYYKNHRFKSGVDKQFKKGHAPFNKGMKGLQQGGKETQFKSGNKPHNYMPVGSERINGDGYVDVKVADPSKWKGKHHIIWEEVNGPVPKGSALIFLDGDRLNVVLDNLALISRRQLAVLNKRGLISKDPEMTRTGVLIADVVLKIGERKERRKRSGLRD